MNTLTPQIERVYTGILRPENSMSIVRLLAVALLACAISGCAALKDDPIMGEKPWQPGTGAVPAGMATAK